MYLKLFVLWVPQHYPYFVFVFIRFLFVHAIFINKFSFLFPFQGFFFAFTIFSFSVPYLFFSRCLIRNIGFCFDNSIS